MSHYIDTKQMPQRGAGKLSRRQLLEIIVGIVIVVALGVAAYAYVNVAESPVAYQGVTADAAPLTMVAHSALDPFETQFVSPTPGTAPAPLTKVAHSALDPFETQFVSPTAETAPAPLTKVAHSALDPFETQFVSPTAETGVGQPSEPIDEGQTRPIPEFR